MMANLTDGEQSFCSSVTVQQQQQQHQISSGVGGGGGGGGVGNVSHAGNASHVGVTGAEDGESGLGSTVTVGTASSSAMMGSMTPTPTASTTTLTAAPTAGTWSEFCERHARAASADFARACVNYVTNNLPEVARHTISHRDFMRRFVQCFESRFEDEFQRRRAQPKVSGGGDGRGSEGFFFGRNERLPDFPALAPAVLRDVQLAKDGTKIVTCREPSQLRRLTASQAERMSVTHTKKTHTHIQQP